MTMITDLFAKYGSALQVAHLKSYMIHFLKTRRWLIFFANVDMDILRDHMADFIGSLTGGPAIYEGKPMDVAHQPYDITSQHYQNVATHLHDALLQAGISEEDTELVMTEVRQLQPSIVNRSS